MWNCWKRSQWIRRSRNGSRATVYVEADGEVLGTLPARIEVADQTLNLLIPPNAQP